MAKKKQKKYFKKNSLPPNEPPDPTLDPLPKRKFPPFLKKTLIVLGVTFLVLALIIVPTSIYGYWFTTSFASAAGIAPNELVSSLRQGFNTSAQSTDGYTNFLILGTDEILGQKEGSLLTDTMILASINHSTAEINLVSLPRDLWIDSLKTKINALYYYGEISQETTGKAFASSVVSEITDLPIHYTFIINLNALGEIINSLDGVEINVPQSFTDDQFPRDDVDIHATLETDLYETITFESGSQLMDGPTALKYIRSRGSNNQDEGTDLARGRRQQQLIQAIIAKISTKQVLQNPHILGNLYYVTRHKLDTGDITDAEIVALAREFGGQFPELNTINLPVEQNEQIGIIYNPPIARYQQWVWEPKDPTWGELSLYLKEQIGAR